MKSNTRPWTNSTVSSIGSSKTHVLKGLGLQLHSLPHERGARFTLARLNASVPFAATRTHLLSAVVWSVVWLAGLALGVGFSRGLDTSLDMLLGGAVVLLPTLWVAMSLTSGHSIFGPVWLGLARYTLAGVGFAALFAVRPTASLWRYWLAVAQRWYCHQYCCFGDNVAVRSVKALGISRI